MTRHIRSNGLPRSFRLIAIRAAVLELIFEGGVGIYISIIFLTHIPQHVQQLQICLFKDPRSLRMQVFLFDDCLKNTGISHKSSEKRSSVYDKLIMVHWHAHPMAVFDSLLFSFGGYIWCTGMFISWLYLVHCCVHPLAVCDSLILWLNQIHWCVHQVAVFDPPVCWSSGCIRSAAHLFFFFLPVVVFEPLSAHSVCGCIRSFAVFSSTLEVIEQFAQKWNIQNISNSAQIKRHDCWSCKIYIFSQMLLRYI